MDLIEIVAIITTGIGIGFSMMGISIAVLYSPFIISIFGGSLGNGIMIFPFLVSDFYMIYRNRKFLNWKIVLKLLPSSILGLIIASIIANKITDEEFRIAIGLIIFIVSILYFSKKYSSNLKKFGWIFGVFGAIASYLGNVSGPIFNIYFLSFRNDTKTYVGTRDLFFGVLNFLKFFIYLFVFKNINSFTFYRGLLAIPFVFIGGFLGKIIITKVNQKTFNLIVVYLGLLVSIKLLFF